MLAIGSINLNKKIINRKTMTTNLADYPLLSLIDTPKDLRDLPQEKLTRVSTELRSFLLNSVSKSSGHFASGLGTIELTVALHLSLIHI